LIRGTAVSRLSKFVLIILFAAPPLALWGQGLPAGLGTLRATTPVRSWQELRQESVVRQKWDLSCGAAALSTILTYDLDFYVSETEIVVWILHRTSPVKIQAQGGFSLLDLKRFAKFSGFDSEGYAELTLEDLQELGRPAIVATRLNGSNHFMIFRGVIANRVVLSDPSFGSTTMPIWRFQEIWAKGIAFIVLPHNASAPVKLRAKRSDMIVANLNGVFREVVDTSTFHAIVESSVLRLAVQAAISPSSMVPP